jgi:hypothetical protein
MAKHLIICGSAECLFDDLCRLNELLRPLKISPDVACINYTALYYPYFFQHWISYHPEIFDTLRKYVKGSPKTWAPYKTEKTDSVVRFEGFKGTDGGLYATLIGLATGHEKIILCGIPLDNSRKFYDPYGAACQFSSDNIQQEWQKHLNDLKDKVRSMSGNTKQMLGEPTKEWINGQ